MSNVINSVVPIFLVLMLVLVGSVFGLSILSNQSSNVNVNNTSYASAYNTQQTEQGITFSLLNVGEIILVFALLLGAVKYFGSMM